MGVKINPNQVSQENLNNPISQPSRVDRPRVPGSGSQPQAPQTPDVSGFKKFQSGPARFGGVFGRPASQASSANRVTTAAGIPLSVEGALERVAEGLNDFGKGPLAPKDLMVLNGALGTIQQA